MKRLQLYKDFLKKILKSYSGLSSGSDKYVDIQDYLDDDNILSALDDLKSTPTLRQEIKPLLVSIDNYLKDGSLELSDDILVCGQIKMFQKHQNIKYSRSLIYFSNNLNVVETCTLYKESTETYTLNCIMFLETVMSDNSKQKSLLRELYKREKEHTYIIQVNKTALGLSTNEANNFENLYAFALAASMNEKNAIEIPKGLSFSWGTNKILLVFTYNKEIMYQEYYDIYDVINDWLHATDILTAFLKMYQIAEYMIYRSQMAEIINRANVKQSFLRETKNLSSKYTKSERDTIISNFINLFQNFTLDPTEVSRSWSFVDKYFGTTKTGYHYLDLAKPQQDIDKGVARFIYDTRCAIVHNKESEFHILYNNYDDYKEIVPLMKSINNIMACKVFEIINTQGVKIHYEHQKLDLY